MGGAVSEHRFARTLPVYGVLWVMNVFTRRSALVLPVFLVLAFFSVSLCAGEDGNSDDSNRPSAESSWEDDPSLDQFRIENTLTIREDGKQDGIRIVTTTLFGKGLVIDFIGDNDEIIIYNREKKSFVLLDPIHRVQTELALSEIDHFLDNLRTAIAEKKESLYRFLLHPDFTVTRNDEAGELSFESKWYEYLITTRSFDDDALSSEYFEFTDVYAKLNLYLNPGTFTPMARIAVNETLCREKRFPARVRLNWYPKGKGLFSKPVVISSEHKIIRRLSEEDLGRIVRANHFAEQFPKLTFGNYYKTVNNEPGDKK